MSDQQDSQNKAGRNDLVLVSDILPDHLVILPVTERPIFPGMPVPLIFTGRYYVEALQAVGKSPVQAFGAVYAQELDTANVEASAVSEVGTVMRVLKAEAIDQYSVQVVAVGLKRFRKVRRMQGKPLITWEVKYHQEPATRPDEELRAYAMAVATSVKELLKLNPLFQEQLRAMISQMSIDKPGTMMDLISGTLTAEGDKLQALLETFPLKERAQTLLKLLKEERELLVLQQEIKEQVDEKMQKQQREFFLREQLKAIKKELGMEKDDKSADLEQFRDKAQALELSEEARKVLDNELDRLQMLEPSSPEYNIIRTYIETLLDLPWGQYSEDMNDIRQARETLNAHHYGLDDVKSRILEFISTIIKRGKLTGSNILLVGPPGVGKTSIGRSIAEALGRKFYRFSVGGMRDEAEIKGHRRTYIGALPGKLIEALRRTGTSNPVIMLDELDKMGSSFQGDPASALLEVLDPEQNVNFLDHYLDVRYDLSKVLFVVTANQLDTISAPLQDRMEVIQLSGYILEEKVEIARKHLIPKQREAHGLSEDEISVSDDALHRMVNEYAREAGVRSLENQIKKIMRQVTLKQAEGQGDAFLITPQNLESFLGKPIFTTEELYNKNVPGTVLGLAYTSMGGATLYIEASKVTSNNGGFTQTGQLGDVMRESASIAYSYIRSKTDHEEACKQFFENHAIHLHVPAGATPKDGPSAGITMALALHSLVHDQPVRADLAMTGELTLTGKVLPIGGVREKTIAARRVGIHHIILPKDNEKDFEELPDYIREGMSVQYANYFDDVVEVAYAQ